MFAHEQGVTQMRLLCERAKNMKQKNKKQEMRVAVVVAVALACLPAGEAFGVAQPALLRYAGQAAAPLGPGFRRARPAVQVQLRCAR